MFRRERAQELVSCRAFFSSSKNEVTLRAFVMVAEPMKIALRETDTNRPTLVRCCKGFIDAYKSVQTLVGEGTGVVHNVTML